MADNALTTVVYGGDLAAARAFYVDLLGFAPLDGPNGAGVRFGYGAAPRREVLVVPHPAVGNGAGDGPHRLRLTARVSDVDGVHRRARAAGAAVLTGPAGTADGGRLLRLRDPHGVTVELIEPGGGAGAGGDRPGLGYQGTSDAATAPPQLPDALLALRTLMNSTTPWALRVAVTLRIPDLMLAGVTGAAELAERTGVDAQALERLLRYLAHKDVFAMTGPGTFDLTPISRLLTADHPAGMAGWLDLHGAAARWSRTYVDMLSAIQTGRPVYERMYGQSFWADLAQFPALSESFDTLMAQQSRWSAPLIEAAYDWSEVHHVVDVGGGSGTLLATILTANEHLRGTLVDRPATVDAALAAFAAAGLDGRGEVHGGSFFDGLPAGADVYLVANVLHDWGDRESVEILRRCAEAVPAHGRVVIVEGIVGGGGDQSFVTELDLLMLVAFGGKERTIEQFTALAGEAGLRLASVHPTASGMSLIQCVPARAR